MKWLTVQKHIGDRIYQTIFEGRIFEEWILLDLAVSDFAVIKMLPEERRWHGEIRRTYAEKAREIILGWDIRRIDKLQELMGEFFPPTLRKRKLIAEYDENGDWCIITT